MIEPDALTFDRELHAYYYGARRLISITQTLHAVRIMSLDPNIPALVLERARARGDAVHLAIRFVNESRLDPTSVAGCIDGYLFAWDSFCAGYAGAFEPILIEQPLCDPALGFAGTPDAVGIFRGTPAVVEVKTCAVMPAGTAVQTAAQRWLANVNGYGAVKRFGVQLRADGTFRLHEYADPFDEHEFRAALLIVNRRLARGESFERITACEAT